MVPVVLQVLFDSEDECGDVLIAEMSAGTFAKLPRRRRF